MWVTWIRTDIDHWIGGYSQNMWSGSGKLEGNVEGDIDGIHGGRLMTCIDGSGIKSPNEIWARSTVGAEVGVLKNEVLWGYGVLADIDKYGKVNVTVIIGTEKYIMKLGTDEDDPTLQEAATSL